MIKIEYKNYPNISHTLQFPIDYKNAGIQRYLQSIQAIEKALV